MANFTPAQHEAIYNLTNNLIVAAGAGAGKTRVLVERYLYLLSQRQATCDEILAITFTNKAAKEMKERIRLSAGTLAEESRSEEERGFWEDVRHNLEYAPIGTFHSFCARVLKDNPVEAGIDPNFLVLDEFEATTAIETVWQKVLDKAVTNEELWLDRLLRWYEANLLKENILSVYNSLAAEGLVSSHLEERLIEPYSAAVANVEKLKEELKELCCEIIAYKEKLKPGSAHYSSVARLENDWLSVKQAITVGDMTVLERYIGVLKAQSKDKELVTAAKEVWKKLELNQADSTALSIMPDLCHAILLLKGALDEYKTGRRVLTFSDMEVRTVELLKNYPSVCAKYNSRIRRIMVDEFQDTNDLQRQIIYLVAGKNEHQLVGNKLFVVGDAKQSIYRFRGADVAVFDRVGQDIRNTGGKQLELDVNFRSMEGLLAVFNECFSAIMGTGADQVKFCQLDCHRRANGEDPPKAEFLTIDKASLVPGQDPRAAEAATIARRIRQMVDNQEALVDHDKERGGVRYGDIAILFRVTGALDEYTAALQQAGIPFYVVGGRGFFHCQEVLDVLNLLRVIENRFHDKALAGVLRSPMFSVPDEALYLLKHNQNNSSLWQGLENRKSIRQSTDEQVQGVDRAWEILSTLQRLRGIIRPSEMVCRALAETEYVNFVFTQFMGEQKYANLQKLMSLVASLEDKGLNSLGDVIRHLTKLVDGDVKEGEAQIESESGDTVKLMTIHKAKGLEFPVVFIPELQRKFNSDTETMVYGEGRVGIKVPEPLGTLVPTSVYKDIVAENKRLAYLEYKRVLYVAFTRAKDYLIVSAVADKVSAAKDYIELNNWLDWLGRVYGFSSLSELPETLEVEKASIRVRPYSGNEPAVRLLSEAAEKPQAPAGTEFIEKLKVQIGALANPVARRFLTPSDIIQFKKCPRFFYYKKIAGLPERESSLEEAAGEYDGLPGHVIGTAFHRTLELLPPGGDWRLCLSQAVRELADERQRHLLERLLLVLLERYVDSELAKEMTECRVHKEWHFSFSLADPKSSEAAYTLTGIADCLIQYDDGTLGIIDYKTDTITSGDTAGKAKEHSLQLVLYAIAAEMLLNRPVKDARVYFARYGLTEPILLDLEHRQDVIEEVVAIFRRTEFDEEEEYPCNHEWCQYCNFQLFCPQDKPSGSVCLSEEGILSN